jgi:anti-sigma-K factor RskA
MSGAAAPVPAPGFAARLWGDAGFWRRAVAVTATASLALLVAALVARDPPDFAEKPVLAVLRDGGGRPAWAIRLARAAHQIALDSLGPPAPAAGKAYQLWLAMPDAEAPQPLGLPPLSGRKIIAETPANIRRLAGKGELRVTLEPANATLVGAPSGPVLFRASLDPRG